MGCAGCGRGGGDARGPHGTGRSGHHGARTGSGGDVVSLALLAIEAGGAARRQIRTTAHAWLAFEGGRRFALAIARRDLADSRELRRRREACRTCPSRVRVSGAGGDPDLRDWCGPPLEEHGGARPTCGCLLVAKTLVGSERCPQGRY